MRRAKKFKLPKAGVSRNVLPDLTGMRRRLDLPDAARAGRRWDVPDVTGTSRRLDDLEVDLAAAQRAARQKPSLQGSKKKLGLLQKAGMGLAGLAGASMLLNSGAGRAVTGGIGAAAGGGAAGAGGLLGGLLGGSGGERSSWVASQLDNMGLGFVADLVDMVWGPIESTLKPIFGAVWDVIKNVLMAVVGFAVVAFLAYLALWMFRGARWGLSKAVQLWRGGFLGGSAEGAQVVVQQPQMVLAQQALPAAALPMQTMQTMQAMPVQTMPLTGTAGS